MKCNKFTLFLTKFIPISKLRRKIRRKINDEIYRQESKLNSKISNYFNKNYVLPYLNNQIPKFEFEKLAKFDDEKIIWQFWYQGENQANNIVKSCFESVKRQMGGGNYKIIILDKDNIKDYLSFPEFIYDKIENQSFGNKTITFFSDLLRVSLLSTYGGVWIDASIFLSDKIDDELLRHEFFMFDREKKLNLDEKYLKNFHYSYFNYEEDCMVKILNSFIISKAENKQICALRDILMAYWLKEKSVDFYCFFHVIFELLRKNGFTNPAYKISDVDCHLLQFMAQEPFDEALWNEIKSRSFLHKLTYFKNVKENSMIEKIVLKG